MGKHNVTWDTPGSRMVRPQRTLEGEVILYRIIPGRTADTTQMKTELWFNKPSTEKKFGGNPHWDRGIFPRNY